MWAGQGLAPWGLDGAVLCSTGMLARRCSWTLGSLRPKLASCPFQAKSISWLPPVRPFKNKPSNFSPRPLKCVENQRTIKLSQNHATTQYLRVRRHLQAAPLDFWHHCDQISLFFVSFSIPLSKCNCFSLFSLFSQKLTILVLAILSRFLFRFLARFLTRFLARFLTRVLTRVLTRFYGREKN